jgi:hypothetical protein
LPSLLIACSFAARAVHHGSHPRRKICVTPEASFDFHQALMPEMTKLLWNCYPADIRAWITSRGGLPPPRTTLVWMRAPETFRFFKKCA